MRELKYDTFTFGSVGPAAALMTVFFLIMTTFMIYYAIYPMLAACCYSQPPTSIHAVYGETIKPPPLQRPSSPCTEDTQGEQQTLSTITPPSPVHKTPLTTPADISKEISETVAQEADCTTMSVEPNSLPCDHTNSLNPSLVADTSMSLDAVNSDPSKLGDIETAAHDAEGSPPPHDTVVEDMTIASPEEQECNVPVEDTSVVSSGFEASPDPDQHYSQLDESLPFLRSLSSDVSSMQSPLWNIQHGSSDEHDVAAHLMQSALLVEAVPEAAVVKETEEAMQEAEGDGEEPGEGDWTSVDHFDAPTPRAATPIEQVHDVPAPAANVAASVVLLTESELIAPLESDVQTVPVVDPSTIAVPPPEISKTKSHPTLPDLTPSSSDDLNMPSGSSAVSPTTPGATRVRVHTPDRPDWAVAPAGEEDTQPDPRRRRHSSAHPDWAVAPDDDDADAGVSEMSPRSLMGRKSLDGPPSDGKDGKRRRRTARRGRHSR